MLEAVGQPNLPQRVAGFYLRRGMRGQVSGGSPANFGQNILFNNSTVAQIIRVWFVSLNNYNNAIAFNQQQALPAGASLQTTLQPMMPDIAPGPGQLYFLNVLAVPAQMYVIDNVNRLGWWNPTFPFALLPPNWCLLLTSTTATQTGTVSLVWDWVYPDELDFVPGLGLRSELQETGG